MVIMITAKKNVATQRLFWSATAALFLFAALTAGCGTAGNSNTDANSTVGPKGPGGRGGRTAEVTIQTAGVQRISIQRQIDLSGSLIPQDEAQVSSEVAGVVRQVFVEMGQEVSAGEVLVKLDPRELELALQRAQSQLRQTEAQLGINGLEYGEPPPDEQISSVRLAMANRDDALAQLKRAQRLRSQNLLPQADLDAAETRVKVTEANYQAALESVRSLKATLQERRHAVELAQKKLNDTVIRASISGQIAERLVQQGEYIRENTPVVRIVQINPLKIRSAIQERHAGLVRTGLSVEFAVESAPGQTFRGKVAYISPSVDLSTRTFPVEVMVDNASRRLKPGFFAKGVIFTHRDENVLAISEDTVSTLAGVSNVYVVEGGKVRQQQVTIGTKIDGMYELLEGLKGDEVLAASNLTLLATGVPVKISRAANTAPSNEGGQP